MYIIIIIMNIAVKDIQYENVPLGRLFKESIEGVGNAAVQDNVEQHRYSSPLSANVSRCAAA